VNINSSHSKIKGYLKKTAAVFTFDFIKVRCYKTTKLFYRSGAVPVAGAVKREEGANPSLSRNCKGRPTPLNATGNTWEGAKKG
jgi:hypothetical protein